MNFGHFYPLPRLTFLPLLLNHPSLSPPTLMSICVCRQPLDLTGAACMNTHGGIYWRRGYLSVATSLRKNDIPPPSPLTVNSSSGRGGGLRTPPSPLMKCFQGQLAGRESHTQSSCYLAHWAFPKRDVETFSLHDRTPTPSHWEDPSMLPASYPCPLKAGLPSPEGSGCSETSRPAI